VTGQHLAGAAVTTTAVGLSISDLQSTATSVSFTLTATISAALGPQPLTVTNVAMASGAAIVHVNVLEALPLLPEITGLQPSVVLTGSTIPALQVTGTNLTGSAFTFTPALVQVTSAIITLEGTAATLSVTVAANAVDSYVLVATNAVGSSSQAPSPANTLLVLTGAADADHDGLTNADELARGLDPVNPDSDGDGWPDGIEIAAGSDPLDPTSIPRPGVVAQPSVLLIRPATGTAVGLGANVTVAEPLVQLIHPVSGLGQPDSDGDGWSDQAEQAAGSDPHNPASQPPQVVVAQPAVLLIRPATDSSEGLAANVTIAQPTVIIEPVP
jgi:hypothetical protein